MLHDDITKKIASGEARMRPRWHFVLHGVGFVVLCICTILIVLYCTSLALFAFHRERPLLGIILIAVGILGVMGIETLIKHYPFAYRKPLLYSIVVIAVVISGVSILVHHFHFHEALERRVRLHRLPVLQPIYRPRP